MLDAAALVLQFDSVEMHGNVQAEGAALVAQFCFSILQRSSQRTLHEDQDVEGVVVLAQRLRDEAVVVRVHHRGVQDAVDVHCTQTTISQPPGQRSTGSPFVLRHPRSIAVSVADKSNARAFSMEESAALTHAGLLVQLILHFRPPAKLEPNSEAIVDACQVIGASCGRSGAAHVACGRRASPGDLDDCVDDAGRVIAHRQIVPAISISALKQGNATSSRHIAKMPRCRSLTRGDLQASTAALRPCHLLNQNLEEYDIHTT